MTRVRAWLAHPAVGLVCRMVLGGLFIYTGATKLAHPAEMARLVNGYRILHPELANLAGITLPWVEVTAGALLVLGGARESAALVLSGLLAVFMGAGFLGLVRGLHIRCGCFFPFMGGDELNWTLLLRDGLLVLLALRVVYGPSGFGRERTEGRERDAPEPREVKQGRGNDG